MTWKLQRRKGSKSCSSPTSSPFSMSFPCCLLRLSSYMDSDFFLKKPKQSRSRSACWILPDGNHASQAVLPQELSIPKGKPQSQPAVTEQSWGSFLESSRSPEIAFFGSDPLPKVIKSSQRIKCINFHFSTAKLGFSPQGDKGEGKQLNCKFLVLIDEFSIRIPACKCGSLQSPRIW